MPQNPVAADNRILVSNPPGGVLIEEFEAAVASAILPGDVVIFNSPAADDCTIKEAGADAADAIGIALITEASNTTPPRGSNRTTAYAAGDQVPVLVLNNPAEVMLRIAASSGQIQCGEYVQPAASGEVKAYICGTDNDCQRIAQALSTTAESTLVFQWALFRLC